MKSTTLVSSILAASIIAGLNFPALAQPTVGPVNVTPAVAPEPTAPSAKPSTTAAVVAPSNTNKSVCPCDFSSGFPSTTNFKSGGISCVVTHTVKQDPTIIKLVPAYSIMLAAVDYGVASLTPTPAKSFANWMVQEEIFYNTDPSGSAARMCADNVKGTQELIHNDAEFQACIGDIKRTAMAAGITCGVISK